MLEDVIDVVPIDKLAVHFHDTYGQALSNILASLQVSNLLILICTWKSEPFKFQYILCGFIFLGQIEVELFFIFFFFLHNAYSQYFRDCSTPLYNELGFSD